MVLGSISQKIDDMLVTNTLEHGEIKETIASIQLSRETKELDCGSKFERRTTNKIFFWVMSGIFLTLLMIFGYVVSIDKKVENHLVNARDAYHEITGDIYVPFNEKEK